MTSGNGVIFFNTIGVATTSLAPGAMN